jgi:mediator of RNA polymerase II transcription subunit 14
MADEQASAPIPVEEKTDIKDEPSTELVPVAAIPPAIEAPPIPHISERFIPVSHIVRALVRTAMLELRQLRDVTADLPDQKRKRRMVEYCRAFKTEFVKVLVLVDWAKDAEAVHRAIDVKAWLQGQANCFDNLYGLLRWDLLRSMEQAKLRNPDILGAVDVLTTGSFPRLRQSDVARQYRIPPTIGPRQVLRTLRTMNALISLRLQLYEVVPWPMRSYTVSSGRARFQIPGAFSAELAFASEDVESPALTWFMIDFSFASGTPQSIKLEVEGMSNALMAQAQAEGKSQLVALYDRLHALHVLYKLERLFNGFSAMDARRRKLFDVKYASAQRTMVVGYWLDQRTPEGHARNSFTVTIAPRGVPKRVRFLKGKRHSLEYNTDALACSSRDHRGWDLPLPFDMDGLDASSLLDAVTNMHRNRLLTALRDALSLACEMHENILLIQISPTYRICVTVGTSDGRFIVHRAGTTGALRLQEAHVLSLQQRLNALTSPIDQANCVRQYQLVYARQDLEQRAKLARWTLFRFSQAAFEREEFLRAFSGAQVQDCVFLTRAREGWQNTLGERSTWFVVNTFVRREGQVHVRLFLAECHVDEERGWIIQFVEAIPLEQGSTAATSAVSWDKLWRFSTARILMLQVSRTLMERGCQYRTVASLSAWRTFSVPSLRVAAKDMPPGRRVWSSDATWSLTQIGETCVLTLHADKLALAQLDLGDLEHDGRLHMTRRVSVQDGVSTAVYELLETWRQLEECACRLESVAHLADRLTIEAATLNKLQLTFGQYHVCFAGEEVSLSTTTPDGVNPYQRILPFLQDAFVEYGSVRGLCQVLLIAQPVLETFSFLEQQTYLSPPCYIVARSVSVFRVYYPTRQAGIELQLRPFRSASATSGDAPETFAEWLLLDLASMGAEVGMRLSSIAHKVGFKAMTLAFHDTNVFGLQVEAKCVGDASITSTLLRVHNTIMEIRERRAVATAAAQDSPSKKKQAVGRRQSKSAAKKVSQTNGD